MGRTATAGRESAQETRSKVAGAGDPHAALVLLLAPIAEQIAEMVVARLPSVEHVEHVPLVDKREIARLLSVSPATIDRMCRAGELPYVVVGDARRFDVADVRAALAARTAAEPKPPEQRELQPAAPTGVRRLSRSPGKGAR